MSITTALKARREALTDREAGFTLIELLVVVIIIGILAAIAIPVYLGVQQNAKESAVKSDLSNIKTAVVAYYTADSTKTTIPALTTLSSYGATFSGNGTSAATVAAGSSPANFCIQATSTDTTHTFYVSTNKGVTAGSCPAKASW